MPVGFPTKVNYATGDVLSATNMNDLSGTVNLLESAQTAAGKNAVINGGFDIWQRGTTFASPTSVKVYTADRWSFWRGSLVAGGTVTRQVTNDTTNLPNIQYCARVQRDSGNTGLQNLQLASDFETVNSIPYAGKTVTVSFYARKGANYSVTASDLRGSLYSGTGTNQDIINGYTGQTTIVSVFQTLTTTWQRFTISGTVPTNSTQLGLVFNTSAQVGTAGAADYFEITGVQLEASTVASAFTRNGGTIQGELAACQRYYYRAGVTVSGGTSGGNTAMLAPYVFAQAATTAVLAIQFPTTMRVEPTVLEFSAIAYRASDTAVYPMTGATIATQTVSAAQVFATIVGATAFRTGYLAKDTNTAGYIAFSAEL
jgi:hypothetical protein